MFFKLIFVCLQIDRAKSRRPPDSMDRVSAPFDPDKFNFTKIDFDKESIFELRTDPEDPADCDFVVLNVSPVEFGHSLLVPNLWDKLPQVVTQRSLATVYFWTNRLLFLSRHCNHRNIQFRLSVFGRNLEGLRLTEKMF